MESMTLQIKNVPPDVHAKVKARAALAGMTISEFLLREIMDMVERPTVAEVFARAQARSGGADDDAIKDAIAEIRRYREGRGGD